MQMTLTFDEGANIEGYSKPFELCLSDAAVVLDGSISLRTQQEYHTH